MSATYGIHDKVDVGVVAPVGSARVSGFSSYYEVFNGVESTRRAATPMGRRSASAAS